MITPLTVTVLDVCTSHKRDKGRFNEEATHYSLQGFLLWQTYAHLWVPRITNWNLTLNVYCTFRLAWRLTLASFGHIAYIKISIVSITESINLSKSWVLHPTSNIEYFPSKVIFVFSSAARPRISSSLSLFPYALANTSKCKPSPRCQGRLFEKHWSVDHEVCAHPHCQLEILFFFESISFSLSQRLRLSCSHYHHCCLRR